MVTDWIPNQDKKTAQTRFPAQAEFSQHMVNNECGYLLQRKRDINSHNILNLNVHKTFIKNIQKAEAAQYLQQLHA